MAVKQWSVGDVLSAADLNVWTVPIVATKTVDTGRNTTTTMTADPELQISVAAGASYAVEAVAAYKGGTNGSSDMQCTLTVPAGTTGFFQCFRRLVSGLSFAGDYKAFGAASDAATNGTTQNQVVLIKSIVTTAGTAGTVAFSWAQNTSNGTNTTVLTGSSLVAQRIS